MAVNYDIYLMKNDIVIRDGDFVIGESDEQHIMDTINGFPGWWKENPVDGVGISSYLNSSGQEQSIARAIKLQLSSDGYRVDSPTISYGDDGRLIINPNALIQ
ncbi:hypothetical protein ACE38W_15015 [Chitinophaga sp. Hz27]|uniref:hypothetical protein n=1 Tax=Chitinophaga sp. Hz27 TaxID=3347169 RepID=UPI0035E05F74